MPEPLFTTDDRVPSGASLPAELQGKSAEEVAKYYQELIARSRTTPPTEPPVTPPPPKPTTAEFMDNPVAATERVVSAEMTRVAKELQSQFNASNSIMQRNMIMTAQMLAERDLADQKDTKGVPLLTRFKDEIQKYMQAFPGWQQADPQSWKVAFNFVIGGHAMELANEAKQSATISEPVAGAPTEPPVPVALNPEQTRVASNFGLSPDRYREGISQLGESKWPITFNQPK